MQRGADGLGAVDQDLDLNGSRQHGLQGGQGRLDAVDGLDDVRPRLPEDHQVDPRLVVGPSLDVGVFRAVDDLGDVLELYRCPVPVGHDQLTVLRRLEQLVVGGQG
ncbi:hypothetical protein D3C76_1578550 [compost metagenome]